MVFPAFGTLLVAAVGFAVLVEPGEAAALGSTVAMPAVAALTDEEGRTAFRKRAKLLMENNFLEIRHAYGQAGLDNGRLSVAG
jgi:hypothetical protein